MDDMQHVASSSKQNAPRGVRDHPRRTMARLSHFVSAALQCHKKLFTVTTHPPAPFDSPSPPLPNKSSDADVTHAVEMWNVSTEQAALALAEDFAPYVQSGSVANPTGQEVSAVQRVSDHVIPDLVQSLATKPDEEIVALLRTAFEACLAFALYQTVSLEFERGPGAFVDGMPVDQRLHVVSESLRNTRPALCCSQLPTQNPASSSVSLTYYSSPAAPSLERI